MFWPSEKKKWWLSESGGTEKSVKRNDFFKKIKTLKYVNAEKKEKNWKTEPVINKEIEMNHYIRI